MNKKQNSTVKTIFTLLTGLFSLLYLINPTAGLFELIPDNFPFLGNLDEAAATAFLLAALRYFGPDLTGFLAAGEKKDLPENKK